MNLCYLLKFMFNLNGFCNLGSEFSLPTYSSSLDIEILFAFTNAQHLDLYVYRFLRFLYGSTNLWRPLEKKSWNTIFAVHNVWNSRAVPTLIYYDHHY